MNNIQRKHLIKRKKRLLAFLNEVSSFDETSITFTGDQNDELLKKIKESTLESLEKKRKIDDWILKLPGLSGRKYRTLINTLISKIKNPSYLEIGSYTGSTACAASANNVLKITCIDNWSQFFFDGVDPHKEFNKNIKKCILPKSSLKILSEDFRKVDFKKIDKHNIFLFDGPHHFEDHVEGITLAQPALQNKFILIVDDWNWDQVRDGTFFALDNLNLEIVSKLEIRTTHDGSNSLASGENSDWHQGYVFFVIKKKL